MALNSKYNNYSERDKQVSTLDHLDALNANTDQVENLLSSIEAAIDSHLDVIEARLVSMESLLGDIKNNTASN